MFNTFPVIHDITLSEILIFLLRFYSFCELHVAVRETVEYRGDG
jgi:hypothetical protein